MRFLIPIILLFSSSTGIPVITKIAPSKVLTQNQVSGWKHALQDASSNSRLKETISPKLGRHQRAVRTAPIAQIQKGRAFQPHGEVSSGPVDPVYKFEGDYFSPNNKWDSSEEFKPIPVRTPLLVQNRAFKPHAEVISEVGDPVYRFI